MSLRQDLIERIAPEIHANDAAYAPPYWSDCTDGMKAWYLRQAEGALDAMLDLLTERADEWDGASFEFSSPPRTQPSNSIESLLDALRDPGAAVLRNPGSAE